MYCKLINTVTKVGYKHTYICTGEANESILCTIGYIIYFRCFVSFLIYYFFDSIYIAVNILRRKIFPFQFTDEIKTDSLHTLNLNKLTPGNHGLQTIVLNLYTNNKFMINDFVTINIHCV